MLPGQDFIEAGVQDLGRGVISVEALLVSIGAPRLARIGIEVLRPIPSPERNLYELLAQSDPDSAHSRYNALIRRFVSFERAAQCGRAVDEERLHEFLRALGAEADGKTRIYLTGGATALLYGWRPSTIDVDIKIVPDLDSVFRAIPRLEEQLQINVELAAPDNFIPELAGWQDRSPFIETDGNVSFHHYDLYSQALAKIERGHAQDLADVREMVNRLLVEPSELQRLFDLIEPNLYRYPAIDPKSFRRAVERVTRTDLQKD